MRNTGFFLLTLLPLFGSPALAKTELAPKATVFLGDLDLRSKAGAAELRRRIDRTVIAISGGDQPQPGSLIPSAELDEARARGRDQADAMISAAQNCTSPCYQTAGGTTRSAG